MQNWILQLNPNNFRLTQGAPFSYYQAGEDDWWGISRYLKIIEPGDTAYIWQSIDHRYSTGPKPRGIYARATIESVPPHMPKYQAKIDEFKKRDSGAWRDYEVEQHQKIKPTVVIKYDLSIALNPLTANELDIAGLENISVLRFTHADIYRLTKAEANKIENLIKDKLKV